MRFDADARVAFGFALLLMAACGADVAPSTGGSLTAGTGSFGGLPSNAGSGYGTAGVGTGSSSLPATGTGAGVGAVPRAGTYGTPATGVAGTSATAVAGTYAPPLTAAGRGGSIGTGSAGTTGVGTVPPPSTGAVEPVVPALTAECPKFQNGTITFMGLGGIQIQAGPKAAAATAPMLFYWHGTGSNAGEFQLMAAPVAQGITSEGGVLVSFQGTTGGDGLSGTAIFGKGDLALADQLLACAVRDHNVDPHRIFVTGCSAGGLFSTAMAALRSSYIAAAAPNSGGFAFPQMFETSHAPALMTVHGKKGQDVVAIDFSDASATADKAFDAAGGFVVNCDTGAGHCGGGGLAGDVWTFFKAHPFGVTPEPWTALPPGFSSQCKLYQ